MQKKWFQKIYLVLLFALSLTLVFGLVIHVRIQNKMDTYDLIQESHKAIIKDLAAEVELPISEEVLPIEESASFNWSGYEKSPARTYLDINTDYMGWISILGTEVNYPLVKGPDNDYYLNRDFYQDSNPIGAIFMDYRNMGHFYDNHTVIYGHYVKNGTMFQNLHLYEDESFFLEHGTVTIEGFYETKTYQIFSAHMVSADDYYLDLTPEDVYTYANALKDLSLHPWQGAFPNDLSILTLATCHYDQSNGRMLIHAYALD